MTAPSKSPKPAQKPSQKPTQAWRVFSLSFFFLPDLIARIFRRKDRSV